MRLFLAIVIASSLFACKGGKNERDIAAENVLGIMHSDSFLSAKNASVYMDSFTEAGMQFVKLYPKDTLSEDLMYRMAGNQYSQQRFKHSAELLNRLIKEFPKGKRHVDALLFLGNVYHDGLNDTANARKAWQQLIIDHPESHLCNDAGFLIENIGANGEQLLEAARKKGGE